MLKGNNIDSIPPRFAIRPNADDILQLTCLISCLSHMCNYSFNKFFMNLVKYFFVCMRIESGCLQLWTYSYRWAVWDVIDKRSLMSQTYRIAASNLPLLHFLPRQRAVRYVMLLISARRVTCFKHLSMQHLANLFTVSSSILCIKI